MDALLAALFDVPVHTSTVRAGAPLDPLAPAEEALVGPRWSPKRRQEFTAGRHCARRALAALDGDAPLGWPGLLRAEGGAPCWPPGVVGSITHTGRDQSLFAACAVTRSARGLGIDAEIDAPLDAELRPRVLTTREAAALDAATSDENERGRRALLVFSAKEAFYKCQSPLTDTFLGFQDVEAELDLATGQIRVRLLVDAGPLPAGTKAEGRFARAEGLVLTTAVLR